MTARILASLARLLVAAASLLLVPAVDAGVPSATNSTIPTCLIAAPDNISLFAQFVIRDIASNPIAGSTVALDFSSCAAFAPCQQPCASCNVNLSRKTITGYTVAYGRVYFDLRLGGVCANERVQVTADGVLLGYLPFASLDQDGDRVVGPSDVARVQSLVGTTDTSADFDCNGVVDANDVAFVQQHVGAMCLVVDPVRRSTWGNLKTIYR